MHVLSASQFHVISENFIKFVLQMAELLAFWLPHTSFRTQFCGIWEFNEFNLNLFSLVAFKRAGFTLAHSYLLLKQMFKMSTFSSDTWLQSFSKGKRCFLYWGNASQMFSNAPLSSEHRDWLGIELVIIVKHYFPDIVI